MTVPANHGPRVSVIITCYNYAPYVAQAIESALQQDHPNTEVIVVDDLSTDGSREIIATWGRGIIPVLNAENRGQGHAFNAGFAGSTGEIVCFLDADDFLAPGALSRLAAEFPAHQSMRHYRMHLTDPQGRPFDVHPKLEQRLDSGDLRDKLLSTGLITTTVTSSQAYRRAFLEQVLPMPWERFRYGADGYLATLAPLYGDVGDGGAFLFANYRRHGGNHSGFRGELLNRADWLLDHDAQRYAVLREHAARLGLTVTEPLGLRDPIHLEQMMVAALFGSAPPPMPRHRIARHGRQALEGTGLSPRTRRLLALWWTVLGLAPRPLARTLLHWKLSRQARPAWVLWLARRLRRL